MNPLNFHCLPAGIPTPPQLQWGGGGWGNHDCSKVHFSDDFLTVSLIRKKFRVALIQLALYWSLHKIYLWHDIKETMSTGRDSVCQPRLFIIWAKVDLLSTASHDDVIKWKHFPRYWPFVRGIPMNSPHKCHWRGALIFSLICAWINGWVNTREAGHLIHHGAHYDVIVMNFNEIRIKTQILFARQCVL